MSSHNQIAQALAFDKRKWASTEATRNTIGVGLVMLTAVLGRNAGAGALASIGALYTGMAASNGVYHARIRAMAASGLLVSLCTALGAFVSSNQVLSTLMVLTVAFGTALYASSSRVAGTVSAQATAILCVMVGLRLPPSGAIGDGLLVAGGSAVQILLLTVVWPMKSGVQERTSVADAFDALAAFVLRMPSNRNDESPQIPPAFQIQEARELLNEAERVHWREENDHLFQALRHAEAIRAALVGFAEADRNFSKLDRSSNVRSARLARSLAKSLRELGGRVRQGRLSDDPIVLKIPVIGGDAPEAQDYEKWLNMLAELIGDTIQAVNAHPGWQKRSNTRSVFYALTRLPDIDSIRAVAFQHALRYAITVEVAFIISERWSRSHAYWLPLTVALVLRQDYGSTFQRGISRLLGTVFGLAICDAALKVVPLTPTALQFLLVVAAWLAFACVTAGYTYSSAAVTGFVVFGIAASEQVTGEISIMRLVSSMLGVIIAVLSYIVWPAWRWSDVWETLKKTASAQSDYCALVLQAQCALPTEDGVRPSTIQMDEARSAARELRIQSETLLASIRLHPQGLHARRLKLAGDAAQQLEENAATILAAQAGWKSNKRDSEGQLREALASSRDLVTQLGQAIR